MHKMIHKQHTQHTIKEYCQRTVLSVRLVLLERGITIQLIPIFVGCPISDKDNC